MTFLGITLEQSAQLFVVVLMVALILVLRWAIVGTSNGRIFDRRRQK